MPDDSGLRRQVRWPRSPRIPQVGIVARGGALSDTGRWQFYAEFMKAEKANISKTASEDAGCGGPYRVAGQDL